MNRETEKVEKIKKSCRVGRTACTVLKLLCAVGAVGAMAGFILVLVSRGQLNATGTSPLIDYGGLGVVVWDISPEEYRSIGIFSDLIPESADPLTQIALVSLFTAVIAALTAVLFHLFGRVFGAILREESPFAETVMKKLRLNFILLTAVILFTAGLGTALVSAFLFWCIYNIFDYGCVLQQDADETL